MYAVIVVYPSSHQVLVGFAHDQADVDGLINDCIAYNGEDRLKEMGIRFNVELAG